MATAEQVEIKVNVGGSPATAVERLGLGPGELRNIYFVEDPTPGLGSSHPLFDAGLVLRLRSSDSGGDSTVKLRPCRRSQLPDEWSVGTSVEDDWEYRIEGDWTGNRHTLAASLEVELDVAGDVAAVAGPAAAFDQRQRDFLAACAALRVNLATLKTFGPIAAERWKFDGPRKLALKEVEVGPAKKIVAERWTLGELDFLELSIRVDAEKATTAQSAFEDAVITAGLPIADNAQSKTEQVLDALTADC